MISVSFLVSWQTTAGEDGPISLTKGGRNSNGPARRRIHMQRWLANSGRLSYITASLFRSARSMVSLVALVVLTGATALAQPSETSGEASLQLPDLSSVSFLGIDGHKLL